MMNTMFSAIFGALESLPGQEASGLPMQTIGINGFTVCSVPANMPSTDILWGTSILNVGNAIYSFGGKTSSGTFTGTTAAFKYDLATDTWTAITGLTQARYWCNLIQISDNEILISGG